MQSEPSAPRSENYLMKMSKDGDTRYFVFTYEMRYGTHSPEALTKQLKDNPIAQQLMAQGYSQPEMISDIPKNIDDAIEKNAELAKVYEPRKNEFPAQYYGAIKTAKRYTNLKDLMSTVKIEK